MDASPKMRIRTACSRCQRRKIKCGGEFPSCSACNKAGVSCVREGKQEVQRSYIVGIEQRVKWLESLVRESRPDVDLDQGPGSTADSMASNQPALPESAVLPSPSSPLRIDHIPRLAEEQPRQILPSQGVEVQQENPVEAPQPRHSKPAHEIGLVSLSPGGEARYIGPSSGYFFADLVFSRAGRPFQARPRAHSTETSLTHLVESPVADLPVRKEDALRISFNFFQTTHLSYPFLHEQSHIKNIHLMYENTAIVTPQTSFHVYMVLAISSCNISRQHKLQLPAEGYFQAAMKHFPGACAENSLRGVQCLLLLIIYALYNPSCSVNIWNLLYQCLASLIDLGLQRDIKVLSGLGVSLLEQEMRTRVFWVIYTLDRTLAILMGRPIGIRDEACELRLPLDISDSQYDDGITLERSPDTAATHITYAIHLFKLARLNSEIKYVMHSICHDPPAYAYPPVRDMPTWQKHMVRRLDDWAADISIHSCSDLATTMAEIKYHEAVLLINRPNPRVPEPAEDSLLVCFHHATESLRKYGMLHRTEYSPLLYTRLTVHSVFLSTLIMLYTVWRIPSVVSQVSKNLEQFMRDIRVALNLLGSIGEHWLEAKKARDCVDELSDATIKWLLSNPAQWTGLMSNTNDSSSSYRSSEPALQVSSLPPAASDPFEFLEDPALTMSADWSDLPDFDNLMWDILNFK